MPLLQPLSVVTIFLPLLQPLWEGSRYQIGWIFLKNSKRHLTPRPLIFGKLYCNFFIMNMVAFMQGGIGHIVSVNINTIVEKTYPEPWNYSSFYQFHAQKALFKVPKICNINFWIENAPPPFWNFSKNSSDLVAGPFPQLDNPHFSHIVSTLSLSK